MSAVTVAIPVRNAGPALEGVLSALARQSVEHELLVCDSGSTDGSPDRARAAGARVIEIAPSEFGHGATRNLLLGEAGGEHVAFLTQDAEPADEHWLRKLLSGFELAGDVALVYGPYRPRSGASPAVRLELEQWFRSLSAEGASSVERLEAHERTLDAAALVGRRGFFSDANACISRAAWQRVPFRAIPYAEDRALALDMLRAGYAKAFVPGAIVIHSHAYTSTQQLRRCFDEWRGLLEVYGWREPASPLHLLRQLKGELQSAQSSLRSEQVPTGARLAALASVLRHRLLCRAGALLGSRADRLAPALRRRLSLEGREGFAPLEEDAAARGGGEPGRA
jgi:GT2 family glycosyltransferase